MDNLTETPGTQTGIAANVIDHAGKIATLQQQHQQLVERLTRELDQVRADFLATLEEALSSPYERIAALEAQIDEMLVSDEKVPETVPAAKKSPATPATPAAKADNKEAVSGKEPDVVTKQSTPIVKWVRRNGRKIARPA